MPVRLAAGVDPRRGVAARLDDGRPLSAGLYRVVIRPPASTGSAGRWLDHPGEWSAVPAAQDSGTPADALALWALVAATPADAGGQSLWVGAPDGARSRVPVNWLAPAELHDESADPGLTPAPDGARASTYLRWLLEPERAAPTRRWRARLVDESLGVALPGADADAADAFADPVIEAFARQTELRVRRGLARLAKADAGLASEVAGRLVRVALVDGVWAPAWNADPDALDSLLLDLLNPRLAESVLPERARAWLADDPPAAAIVVDDTSTSPDGGRLATVSITNLLPGPRLCRAGGGGSGVTPDLSPAPAFGFVRIEAKVAGAGPAPDDLTLGAGAWRTTALVTRVVPAHPPGAMLTHFSADWTMSAWLDGPDTAPVLAADSPWRTSVLLHRTDLGAGGATAASGGSWAAYVECRTPAGADASREAVRLWVGAFGAPTAVLRVTPDGTVHNERRAQAGAAAARSSVRVTRGSDRWSFQVALPEGSVGADGLLRVGVERTDASGRRAAWPRAMLPWHTEPARGLIDTMAWRKLSTNGEGK